MSCPHWFVALLLLHRCHIPLSEPGSASEHNQEWSSDTRYIYTSTHTYSHLHTRYIKISTCILTTAVPLFKPFFHCVECWLRSPPLPLQSITRYQNAHTRYLLTHTSRELPRRMRAWHWLTVASFGDNKWCIFDFLGTSSKEWWFWRTVP